MKILHLIDSRGLYGAEQVLLTLVAGMNARGHDATVGSVRLPDDGEKPIEAEAKRKQIPLWTLPLGRGIDFKGCFELRARCEREGVQIIHSHGYKANIVNALFFARHPSFTTVATLHGWTGTTPKRRIWWYEALERRLIGRMHGLVAVHRDMAFSDRLSGAVKDKTRVILNGITPNVDPVKPTDYSEAERELAAFCSRRPTMGMVGRISREKAVEDGIRALNELCARGLDLQLAIVGTGSREQACKDLVRELGLQDRVLFAGFLPRAGRMLDLFAALVLSSTQEGMPIVVLEAMRAGVPLVASRVGGIPDLLDEGRCGRLFEAGRIDQLTNCIKQVLADAEETKRLADAARARFSALYSDTQTIEGYLRLYEALAGTQKEAARAVAV